MLINTILVEQTIAQHQLLGQFSPADYRGLSPLFTVCGYSGDHETRVSPSLPASAADLFDAHGIISPKLQLLSGHTTEQSLAMYRELTLGDVVDEYEAAMRIFPVR